MNTLLKNGIAAALLLLALAAPALAEDERTDEVALDFGKTLEIDTRSGGSVSIEGWNQATLQVISTERHGNLDAFEILVEETRGGARIEVNQRDRKLKNNSLHFEIMVPKECDVDFSSGGGSFTIVGVDGKFTGKTGGGRLSFEDVRGEVRMRTGGGQITVVDSELDGKLQTGGGQVLIQDVVGDLRASSGGGNVVYENVRSKGGDLRGPRGLLEDYMDEDTVMIQTAGGAIDVDDAPAGASVRTGGGQISVRNASRFVDAQTGGGDISIRVENGWAKARTGAGDIDVVIEGDAGEGDKGAFLNTGSGDVELTLPAGISARFEIDIAYTKNSRQNFEIESDFDLEQELSDEWDYSQGSPRKHIYGTGSVGGGDALIKIRTTNGNVRIRSGR